MIEVITHCWRYSGLLGYHLGSLVNSKIERVRVTVFTCHEDRLTISRVEQCQLDVRNPLAQIQLRVVDKTSLMRRAIMRNRAACETDADVVWFCDADYVFGENCLDSLPGMIDATCPGLWFPKISLVTSQFDGDVLSELSRKVSGPLPPSSVYPLAVQEHRVHRAIGGLQITNQKTANQYGYCQGSRRLMKPADEWQVTTEDSVYRRSLGTCGEAIELPNLHRIRHSTRGYIEKDVAL